MLQSLDTLIAFVVIMTIASLFVTIIVQMLSAALSLRGKNLANALALTFQTIDPSLAEEAHQLAAKILSDPLLSDSTRTHKDKERPLRQSRSIKKTAWHFTDVFDATRLANAIRPEEVYATLKKLAAAKTQADEALAKARKELRDSETDEAKKAAQTHIDQSTPAAPLSGAAGKILDALAGC